MLYFAYGSNMCEARLQRRVPSARALQTARLSGYKFRFHKQSSDGSAKGNAFHTGNPEDAVYGVLFHIDGREKAALDMAEAVGKGYAELAVTVSDGAGNRHEAFMYVAEHSAVDDQLFPYTWYKRFVVEGARQHALPDDYLSQIEAMTDIEDPDRNRARRNAVILSAESNNFQ